MRGHTVVTVALLSFYEKRIAKHCGKFVHVPSKEKGGAEAPPEVDA